MSQRKSYVDQHRDARRKAQDPMNESQSYRKGPNAYRPVEARPERENSSASSIFDEMQDSVVYQDYRASNNVAEDRQPQPEATETAGEQMRRMLDNKRDIQGPASSEAAASGKSHSDYTGADEMRRMLNVKGGVRGPPSSTAGVTGDDVEQREEIKRDRMSVVPEDEEGEDAEGEEAGKQSQPRRIMVKGILRFKPRVEKTTVEGEKSVPVEFPLSKEESNEGASEEKDDSGNVELGEPAESERQMIKCVGRIKPKKKDTEGEGERPNITIGYLRRKRPNERGGEAK